MRRRLLHAPRHAALRHRPRPRDGTRATPRPARPGGGWLFTTTAATLFFTRLPFQGSHTKRYHGGTAQSLWKFAGGAGEAVPLTADYTGTSKSPMWWNGRVYFLRPRRHHERLVDERGRARPAPAHQAPGLGRRPSRRSRTGGSSTDAAPTFASSTSRAAATRPRDHALLRLRPAARDLGQEADGVPELGPPLTQRGPRRPHRSRPGVRRAGEAGAHGRAHAQGRRSLPPRDLPSRRQGRGRSLRTSRARSSSGRCPRTAWASPRQLTKGRRHPALGGGAFARRQVDRAPRQGPRCSSRRGEEDQ